MVSLGEQRSGAQCSACRGRDAAGDFSPPLLGPQALDGKVTVPPARASPASCSTGGSPQPGLWGTHPLPLHPAWPRCPVAACTHPRAKRRPSIWVLQMLPLPPPSPTSWLWGRGAQPHHGTDPSARSALSHPAARVQDPQLRAARMGPRGAGRCTGRGEGSVPRQGVTEGGERELVQWSSHTDGSCSSGP